MDAGHQLDETTLKSLELADDVILVANQTVPALSNAKKLLELLQLLGLEKLQLHVWLNSWQKHGDLSVADVSGFLGREVSGIVQFDAKEVTRSINEGAPLAKIAPNHAICRDLKGLAEKISGAETATEKASRWGVLNFLRR